MFLNLQVFALEEQIITFAMNVLLSCILYCGAGAGCDLIELFASTVGRFLSRVRTFFFGDAVALLRESYVSCSYLIEPMFLEFDI